MPVPEPPAGPAPEPVPPHGPARGARWPAREVASFRWAGRGVRAALRREPHLRFHAVATVVVAVLAAVLPVSATQRAVLLLAVGLVWVAELANTAIECLVDLVRPDVDPVAGLVKDVAAGAVLVAAVVAAGAGTLVLGPPLLDRVTGGG